MITLIRSLTELRLITQSRAKKTKNQQISNLSSLAEDCGQRKRYLRSISEKNIDLTNLNKIKRSKWREEKDAVNDFLDDLSYDKEIRSSDHLQLIDGKCIIMQQNAA